MNIKCLVLAAALTAAAPAFAISVNVTDFTYADPSTLSFSDDLTGVELTNVAGRFYGTLSDTPAVSTLRTLVADSVVSVASQSFTGYCAEVTQSFSFGETYVYTQTTGLDYFGAQKTADLSRLFTATAGFVVDSATSGAMQAAIWEIIYEQGSSYNLGTGHVTVMPNSASGLAAFATINGVLANLASYGAGYGINVLTNPDHQDFISGVIPEPGTWALMLMGLGAVGWAARRARR